MRRIINKTLCVAGRQQNDNIWKMAENREFLRNYDFKMSDMNDFEKLVKKEWVNWNELSIFETE